MNMLRQYRELTRNHSKDGLQRNFQDLNAKVNQNVDARQTDRQTTSIHKPELLCNLTKNYLIDQENFLQVHDKDRKS